MLFKKLYFKLFNAITYAIDAIEAYDYGRAKEILVDAQASAEDRYITWRAKKEGRASDKTPEEAAMERRRSWSG